MRGTRTLAIVIALTVVSGCASTTPPPSVSSKPAVTTTTTTSTTASTVNVAAVTWPTTPVTVVHQPKVPPVPVIEQVRYASHDGYDRIVLDIPGALPGYTAKYVTELRQDGSGKKVTIPGKAFLLIVLNPAQSQVTGTHRIDLPGITSYAVIGDYEGYVSFALGLSAKRGFRIGELSDRIYIDVAV